MSESQSISDHRGQEGRVARILEAMKAAGMDPATVTVEQLATSDHFHGRRFPATVDLADALRIQEGHRLVDIGCGPGSPARYLAQRFDCLIDGIDITAPFVQAANALTGV